MLLSWPLVRCCRSLGGVGRRAGGRATGGARASGRTSAGFGRRAARRCWLFRRARASAGATGGAADQPCRASNHLPPVRLRTSRETTASSMISFSNSLSNVVGRHHRPLAAQVVHLLGERLLAQQQLLHFGIGDLRHRDACRDTSAPATVPSGPVAVASGPRRRRCRRAPRVSVAIVPALLVVLRRPAATRT